ncbi:MAG: Wzz/FepE/Etk N-terminal domain-containing protein [Flavobacteriales bacterium]
MSNTEETTLKDVIISIRDFTRELKKKFILISTVLIISIILGLVYSSIQKDKFEAVLSFIVEGQSEGPNLSSISGMASQFGLDLGGSSSSTFSQQNVIELLKSRKVIESTLSKSCIVNNEEDILLNHYISINNMIEDGENISFFSSSKDSITNIIWKEIIDFKIDLSYQNDEANILNLTYTSTSSEFAKNFTELLVEEISQMYSHYQTEKTKKSLKNLELRSDSIFRELKNSERNFARVKDRNLRVINASGRLDEIQYMREVQVLNAIYLELIKNTELVKMNLLNETPIIQLIDVPVLPLEYSNRSSKLFWVFSFSFLGLFLVSSLIILRKLIRDTLEEDN